METLTIEIKRKHFLKSKGYLNTLGCPLALAVQEYFKNNNITVGGFYFNTDDLSYYTFNNDLWNYYIVNFKIKEAQKCLKSKKKFNSVFLELTKTL